MREFSSTPGRQMGADRLFNGSQAWGVASGGWVSGGDEATVSVTNYLFDGG
jgi:hypothetical protein